MNQWHWVRWVGVVACILAWAAIPLKNEALWLWASAVGFVVCVYGVAVLWMMHGRRA